MVALTDPDLLFPPEAHSRSLARDLYAGVKDLPIVSPHGHTDPRWFAPNEPFPDPAQLLLAPDHYLFRMLYSQGVALEALGVSRAATAAGRRPIRATLWRLFAEHYYLFRGTPSRLWLDHVFAEVFGFDVRARRRRPPIVYYDRIGERWRNAGIPPARAVRPLQHRGARHHRRRRRRSRRITRRSATSGWKGRVVTAYRPDRGGRSGARGFSANRRALRRTLTGEDPSQLGAAISPRTAQRRAYLQVRRRDLDRSRPPDRRNRRPLRTPRPRRCSTGSVAARIDERETPSCSAPRC